MAKRKMTAKQAKYFSKGHGKVVKGGRKAAKKGAKKMPMINGKPAFLAKKGAKGTSSKSSSLMAKERAIEKKTKGKPKTAREKMLEARISKLTGKKYKGKR